MATAITISGINPLTGQMGTNSISQDDAHAATMGRLVLQTLGYQPTVPDPDNPGQSLPNPQTPGAAILEYLYGHLRSIADRQEQLNALAATAAQSVVAAIPPPTLT